MKIKLSILILIAGFLMAGGKPAFAACSAPTLTVRENDSNGVVIGNEEAAITPTVYVSASSTCDGTAQYSFELWYYNEPAGWTKQTSTSFSTTNSATFPLTSQLERKYQIYAYAWDGAVIDSSSSGNNGTAQGGASPVAGKFGNAGSFNGTSSYISMADSATLSPTQVTISHWIYPTAAGTAGGDTTTVWKGNIGSATDQSYGFLWDDNRKIFLRIGSTTTINQVGSVAAIPLNQWTHVAATYNGTTMRIYINGVLDNSATTTITALKDTTQSLYLGASFTTALWKYFSGQIDDARIYNRALTDTEISSIYNNGNGDPTGTVATVDMKGFWKMNESSWVITPSPATISSFYGMTKSSGQSWSSGGPDTPLSYFFWWNLRMNYYPNLSCAAPCTFPFYLLYGTDPAILTNRSPDPAEVLVNGSYSAISSNRITWSGSITRPGLTPRTTYYWRVRSDHPAVPPTTPIADSYFQGGTFYAVAAPTITLKANDTQFAVNTSGSISVNSGDSVTLSWTSTDATSCTGKGGLWGTTGTPIPTSSTGTSTGPVTATTQYDFICTNSTGTRSLYILVFIPNFDFSITNDGPKTVAPGQSALSTLNLNKTVSGSTPQSTSLSASTWSQNTPGWGGRSEHASVGFQGKMWVLGGLEGSSYKNDVWSSPDGAAWTQMTAAAPWAGRRGYSAVSFGGKIWVMGGVYTDGSGWSTFYTDVWSSSDGINWTQETTSAPWAPRAYHASVAFNNKIWVMGGYKSNPSGSFPVNYNDVWSSTDGINWTQVTAAAPWGARIDHTAVVFNNGSGDKIWIMGGGLIGNPFLYSDTWSSSDGANWTREPLGMVVDSSGFGNHGTAQGNTVPVSSGRDTGNAGSFDGFDDVIRIPHSPSLDVGGIDSSYSFSAWIKTTADISTAAAIVGKSSVLFLNNTEKPCFQISDGSNAPTVCASISVNTNSWYHLVGVRNIADDTISIYIGDALYGSTPDTTVGSIANTSDISIGNSGSSYTQYDFNGLIDDVRIYNQALDATEIASLDSALGKVGHWEMNEPTWAQGRTQHTSLVFNNKIWLIGGCAPTCSKNDVFSSTDGINLIQETASADWSARSNHTSLVFNEKMWVIGGNSLNDVWSSTDGKNWTPTTGTAATTFSSRAGHSSAVLNDKLWVMGGDAYGGVIYTKNDVWSSVNGADWTLVKVSAPWAIRRFHTSVAFNNNLWVIGGQGSTNYNDVWSSVNGITWTQATAAAGWSQRFGHASVVFNNKIWVMGGSTTTGSKNDVWSSDDGINWTQVTASAGWDARRFHTAVVFNNKMWVIGGEASGNACRNDAWWSTDGITWTRTTQTINSVTAFCASSAVTYNNKMWLIAGNINSSGAWPWEFYKQTHNLHYSTDGTTWTEVLPTTLWTGRAYQTAEVFKNKLWVLGGYYRDTGNGGTVTDPVWSSPDPTGLTFSFSPTSCTPNPTCSSSLTTTANFSAIINTTFLINVKGTPTGSFTPRTTQFLFTVTVPPAIPSITSTTATDTSFNATTLNSSVNPNNDAATTWFRYSSVNPGSCNDTFGTKTPSRGGVQIGTGNNPVAFLQSLSGLSSGIPYYFCTVAQNSLGKGYGAVQSFTTISTSTSSSACQQNNRASGLISVGTSTITGKFGNIIDGRAVCVIDPKAAFAPFKIPTFDDLKSLYYDQK